VCDFVEGEAFVLEENQSLTLQFGQLRDHLGHHGGQFLIRAAVSYGRGAVLVHLRSGMVIAIAFEGKIPGYGEEIGLDAGALGVEALRVADKGEEAVLGDVFGEVWAARESIDEAVKRLVMFIECLFRRHLALYLLNAGNALRGGSFFTIDEPSTACLPAPIF
jgi:hypothetical protein